MISGIVAMTSDFGIGKNGGLPWNLPSDLAYFRRKTRECAVIMGRKTFESIMRRNGRPLTGRRNIVLTRSGAFARDVQARGYCETVGTIEEALQWTNGEREVFVIGGATVYRLAMPYLDRVYVTRVCTPRSARVVCDTFFPFPQHICADDWECRCEERAWKHDTRDDFPTQRIVYERTVESAGVAVRGMR